MGKCLAGAAAGYNIGKDVHYSFGCRFKNSYKAKTGYLKESYILNNKNLTAMNIIGQRIKKLREEKGITQEAMALQLDVTQSNYGRLEKDDRRLNVVKLLKIVRILDVNITSLFNEVLHSDNSGKDSFSPANKEVYDMLVESLRAENQHLKEEINFLRVMVKS